MKQTVGNVFNGARRATAARRLLVATLAGLLLHGAGPVFASGLPLPDLRLSLGREIVLDGFVDEQGRPVADAADRRAWLVCPIYTRCPTTCSALADGLRRALSASELRPSEYRVLLLSFDPEESDASLAAFRRRLALPQDWLTVRAHDRNQLVRALRGLDFRTIELDDGRFEHPNLVAVLDADRRVSGYVYGIAPAPAELRRAVRRAAAGGDGTWLRWLPVVATACGFLLSAMMFIATLMTSAGLRRRSSTSPPPERVAAGSPP